MKTTLLTPKLVTTEGRIGGGPTVALLFDSSTGEFIQVLDH